MVWKSGAGKGCLVTEIRPFGLNFSVFTPDLRIQIGRSVSREV